VLHVESEIVELKPSRSRPDRGIATVRSETRDQLGEIVQVLLARPIVPRKSLHEKVYRVETGQLCIATIISPVGDN
jgi:hypothetical protein